MFSDFEKRLLFRVLLAILDALVKGHTTEGAKLRDDMLKAISGEK